MPISTKNDWSDYSDFKGFLGVGLGVVNLFLTFCLNDQVELFWGLNYLSKKFFSIQLKCSGGVNPPGTPWICYFSFQKCAYATDPEANASLSSGTVGTGVEIKGKSSGPPDSQGRCRKLVYSAHTPTPFLLTPDQRGCSSERFFATRRAPGLSACDAASAQSRGLWAEEPRASWQAAVRPGSALERGPLDGVVLEAPLFWGRWGGFSSVQPLLVWIQAVERPVFRQHSQGAGWLSSSA